jgi:hypothetical protein
MRILWSGGGWEQWMFPPLRTMAPFHPKKLFGGFDVEITLILHTMHELCKPCMLHTIYIIYKCHVNLN